MATLVDLLDPVSRLVKGLDLAAPEAAEASLAGSFPPDGEAVAALMSAANAALAEGSICDREGDGVRFSRVRKPKADPGGCSIDAVLMEDSAGPWHTHVAGEVCLCIPQEGNPVFDGRSATWMVLPVGSRHAPRVENGRMLILYWWPGGAVKWG